MIPTKPLGQTEFIVLTAVLFATIAFSIDAMLPAFDEIASELSSGDPNRAQLIITSFVFGMGVGTFLAGPLSDTFGRRKIILGGAVIYTAGALLAWVAPTLELVLAARMIQGLGAAGPRIASLAMVRDLYEGRQMARIMSIAMIVFMLVPAIAPLIGTVIIAGFGWRAIFGAFILFSITSASWLFLRQPETHPIKARQSLSPARIWSGLKEILSYRVIVTAILVQVFGFGALFGTLSSTQQIFDQTFDRGIEFPYWFAFIAIMAGTASVLNATIVVRLGMRRVISTTLIVLTILSLSFGLLVVFDALPAALYFPAYVAWNISVFAMAGLTFGNINAMAMEPVGHIAGLAASVVSSLATVLGVMIAIPVGLAFDGTPAPLAFGVFGCTLMGVILMSTMPKQEL